MFALVLKSLKSVNREAHCFHALIPIPCMPKLCSLLNDHNKKRSAGMSTNRSWWMQSGHVWKLQFKAQICTAKQNIWIACWIISHRLLERELSILVKQCCHRSGGFCWPIFIRLLRKRKRGRTDFPIVTSGCHQVAWILGQLSLSKHLTWNVSTFNMLLLHWNAGLKWFAFHLHVACSPIVGKQPCTSFWWT